MNSPGKISEKQSGTDIKQRCFFWTTSTKSRHLFENPIYRCLGKQSYLRRLRRLYDWRARAWLDHEVQERRGPEDHHHATIICRSWWWTFNFLKYSFKFVSSSVRRPGMMQVSRMDSWWIMTQTTIECWFNVIQGLHACIIFSDWNWSHHKE